MNGIYWGLTALALMGHKDALPKDEMLAWVMSCWNDDVGEPELRWPCRGQLTLYCTGAFAPHPGHDPHIHPTLSAIQILAIHNALHLVDKDKIVKCASRCLALVHH